MRIEMPSTPVPAAGSVPGTDSAALALGRAALIRDAALIAASPWTALAPDTEAPPTPGGPPWVPPSVQGPAPLRPAGPSGTPGLPPLAVAATAALPAGSVSSQSSLQESPPSRPMTCADAVRLLPLPATAAVAANATPPRSESPARERLTLSPALVSLHADLSALTRTPAGRLMLQMLEALTGEPTSQLQLFTPGTAGVGGPGSAIAAGARLPDDLMQLLVRARVRGADAQQVDMSFGLNLQRPPGSAIAPGLQHALQAAIEQLAQSPLELEYPGAAAHLAGQRAHLDALLDPRGLWPLQSFFVSGLLIFGPARQLELDTADDDDEADDEHEVEARADEEGSAESQAESPPKHPRRKRKALVLDELTPLPADGGVPIISAQRWLALELRHLRRQLRSWMTLPPMPTLAPS